MGSYDNGQNTDYMIFSKKSVAVVAEDNDASLYFLCSAGSG